MASLSAVGTTQNNPNFLGTLYEVGQNATPFLAMLGGINGARPVSTTNFALSTNYVLDSASQPAISEDASVTGATASTYAQTQVDNAIQIFQRVAQVSYANASDVSTLSGIAGWQGNQNVTNKIATQVERNLRQMAVDLEYTLINGSYTAWGASNVASGTRGLTNAITTNSVDGGAGALTKAMVNTLTKDMVDNGAELDNGQCVILVNSTYKQALTDLFALEPRDRAVGGLNLEVLVTDFGQLGIVYCPSVAQTEVIVADMSKISLAVLPVDGQAVKVEPIEVAGASESMQIYAQLGNDYGNEIFHGKITNLA